VEARAAREEAERLAMMMLMQQSEQKLDARYEDDKVWGAGIMNMIAKTVKGVAQCHQERETEREVTARRDGGGLEASQHADTTRDDGPKERQQLQQQQQPQPRPKLQLKLQQKPQPMPRPQSAPTPTPARQWETVPPRAKSQRAPVGPSPGPGPGPAPTAGSSMAERRLILRRDESVPLFNKMDQEIASAINRALFQQKAPAHIRIMNAKRNDKGAITTITQPNATAEMALQYRDIIIAASRTVDKGVVDAVENESWERLKIHAVPLKLYMGKGTEGLQKTREEFEAENKGIVNPTQVLWLVNPRTIRERRQNVEIAASLLVFVVKGNKMPQTVVKKGIKAAGVWYRVETYTNEGPDSRCEPCRRWGHIENKCGSMPKCGYCSGHHRTSDHKCNVVGFIPKKGSLCGHTLEKCPNCRGNDIALSSRCVKKREATEAARQSRKIGLAGRAPTSAAEDLAARSNRVMLGPRPQWVAEGGGDEEEEMADVDEEDEEAAGEARDVTMADAETETATRTATDTETEIGTGARATNDYSDPAQLRKVIRVDHCGAGAGS